MTLSTTLFLLAGVLLNAGAQLLLKAGVNAVGPIHFGASALWPTVGRVLIQWPVLAGLACYVVSVGGVDRRAVAGRGLASPIRCSRSATSSTRCAAWWLFGEALGPARLAGIAVIMLGVFLVART